MINVLMAFSSLTNGGMGNFVKELVQAINKDNYHIDFLIYEEGDADLEEFLRQYGCEIYKVANPKGNYGTCKKEIAELHEKKNYQVMHSLNLFNSGYMVKIARELKIPIRIVHSHASQNFHNGWMYEVYKKMMRHYMKRYATNLIGCSDLAGEYLFGKLRFEVIENAIDTAPYAYNEENRRTVRNHFGYLDNDYVVGMVGMVTENKNQTFMMDVIKDMEDSIRLCIVGDGDYRQEANQKIEDLHLEDRVTITGWQNDTSRFYSAFDCLVMPSFSEGFPLVGLEAQANGLPILFADTITKEVNLSQGVQYLPLNTVTPWQEAIKALKGIKPARQNAIVGTPYDIQTAIQKWELLYETGSTKM